MCTPGSVSSWPAQLTVPIDYLDSSLYSQLAFAFDWRRRLTQPTFVGGSDLSSINEEPTIDTRLRLNGILYTLVSVQIVEPTHRGWVQTNPSANRADVVITFVTQETSASVLYKFVVCVIPLIDAGATAVTDSAYLRAMTDPVTAAGGVSLQDLFPNRTLEPYPYYMACIAPATGTGATTAPTKVLTTVATAGLQVSTALLDRIQQLSGNLGGKFAATAALPFMPARATSQFVIDSSAGLKNLVKITFQITSTRVYQTPTLGQTGAIPVSAFKCVTFDPEKQVDASGNINIDVSTGKPLDAIQKERADLIAESQPMSVSDDVARQFYTWVPRIIAFFFIGVIALSIIYYVLAQVFGIGYMGGAATTFQRIDRAMWAAPTYIVIALLCTFGGFLAGVFLLPKS